MNLQIKSFLFFILLTVPALLFAQKQFVVKSPDGKLQALVSIGSAIEYSVSHNGDILLDKSAVSMQISGGEAFGVNPKLKGSSTRVVDQILKSDVYKKKEIKDHFNELILKFKGDYELIFRAYNEGIAYRFVSLSKKPFNVESEKAEFNFASDQKAYIPYVYYWTRENPTIEDQFFNSFENAYTSSTISEWDKTKIAFLPLLVEATKGRKICITESDLLNYPGMYLHNNDASTKLQGTFAPYPKDIKQGGHNMLQGEIQSREPYLAKYEKGEKFPWRIIIVSVSDKELANNDMVYKLASPADEKTDYSWIKPGKVAWDWWNDWNIYDVDFEAGVNNKTYKYYIDFASKHGIEYVILDEGWSVNLAADLMQVVPEINLKELVDYATKKNVGLILWAGYYAFNKDIEGICKHYSEMGIKGFKIDFMDRDDQMMVDFHTRTAQAAAKYKMLVDFHGSYKPAGLQRTYPNVINFEGVMGLENVKWKPATVDMVTYDVTIPYTRMVAGPMDYTQGAMRNATKENYHPVNTEPMSQGTRCHQLAEYVIFESPLNMMCDSPSAYMKEEECTNFIASIPTVWDETMAINGEVAKYVTIARRKGDVWYLGSLNNWDKRELELDLSFLDEGSFTAEVFKDGVNAHRIARDYKKEIINIPSNKKINISMASGGGYIMKISKK